MKVYDRDNILGRRRASGGHSDEVDKSRIHQEVDAKVNNGCCMLGEGEVLTMPVCIVK